MKKYFAQLRPLERRLAFGVMVILILVLNWVFIRPHFSDFGNLRRRGDGARQKLELYQKAIAQTENYKTQVKTLESQGEFVAAEEQSANFVRSIQTQSSQSGVQIVTMTRQPVRTNDAFFVEQIQNVNVLATDVQLVDFLYKLGSGSSMIRVRDMELQPDAPRQHLNAGMKLVASYQKNPAANQKSPATNLKPATAKAK